MSALPLSPSSSSSQPTGSFFFFLSLRLPAPGEPSKLVAPRSLLTTIFPSSRPCQEFFSVAWTALTVVTQAGHKKRWNMLAAAGLRGMVRLLHVRAGFCCSVIRAHKKAIATLCFSPTHESHLFSKTLNPELPQHRRLSALVPYVSFWGLWGSQDAGHRWL